VELGIAAGDPLFFDEDEHARAQPRAVEATRNALKFRRELARKPGIRNTGSLLAPPTDPKMPREPAT
jgi:hypothetical protein